ncbi:uncharacterized protein [Venturia canescens]|uniref:uncharacterized protein n=1 Tax=Venturia canescens TaxID=32260 RepID=UPI001C9BCEBE|nr:uncharacterized protein LOC122418965 [Venturia canescens]
MWKFVGMTILLSRAVIANINEENSYYLSEREEENRSLEGLGNSRGTTSELTRLDENENEPREKQQPENESLLDYSNLKSQPKRSIVRMNLNERRSELRQAPASLATLLYWPERQDQAIRMDTRRNPSFSPWGGKRDMDRYKTITKIRRPVRVPFNSWGGKRSTETDRIQSDYDKRNEEKDMMGEREPRKPSPIFHSWGGKRRSNEFPQSFGETSKHSYDLEDPLQKERSDMDNFSNYRDQSRSFDKLINNEAEGKRGSLKLVGSSPITTSGSTVQDHFARVPFEPWGGKRTSELQFSDDDPQTPSVSLIFRKSGQIFP